MNAIRKDRIRALLKGIETGDEASTRVVHPGRYVQHNPQTEEGGEGLAALFKRLAKTSPRVNIVRLFTDGDFVFGHTEYDFGSPKVGFEIFRFEGEQTVEHWDNIQPRQGPNASGHGMVDGPTEAVGPERTEFSRELVRAYVSEVLIERRPDRLQRYVAEHGYTEHDPLGADGIAALRAALFDPVSSGRPATRYDRLHRLQAEGNFVLAVSEGVHGDAHSSFFDLFRVERERIVEHWDTIEAIPPRSEWKNDNGKF